MAKKQGKKTSAQRGKTVSKSRLASSAAATQRKKTIVGGFNPEVDFGEILNTWERTGEVELDLSTKKSRSASQIKRSFGDILAEWEGEKKPKKAAASEPIKNSDPYTPTQDFGDLLDAFEGKRPKKKRSVAADTSEERPAKAREPKKRKVEEEIPLRPSSEMEAALSEKAELDAERGESIAAWSFADTFTPADKQRPRRRQRATEQKEEEPAKEEIAKQSEPYVPTEDFGTLLAAFEEKKRSEQPAQRKEQQQERPRTPKERAMRPSSVMREALSEKAELDAERKGSTAAWSFADTYRSWSLQADEEKAIQRSQAEKRERVAKMESIAELRALLPEETIDLHGLTANEAEEAVAAFLKKSHEAGLRKVAIITGKGLHNELGYSIVKEVALEQIRLSGLVREAFAPKARYGGSGAIWIILKKE